MSFIKERSPFTPGNPVPVDLFVGRKEQIETILQYIKQGSYGKQENIFLVGERGIGKSSLASFLRYLVTVERNFLGAYVSSGGITELEELVRRILEETLREINKENALKDKLITFLKEKARYIEQAGFFGISISFNPPKDDLEYMVRNFPDTIKELWKKIMDKKTGIFIVLDDINGLSRSQRFANWYKSLVDNVSIKYQGQFPIVIMIIGLPEIRDSLVSNQPSLMRVFRVIDIDKLSNEEVKQFFEKAFKSVGMKVKPKAMEVMVTFSSGLPILMHEIGDAIFWQATDKVIDEGEALNGITKAADSVGRKYLDPKVYNAIRSERYRSILRKLGEKPFLRSFKRSNVESKLNANEKKVFNNFLRKMRKLGVIISDREMGRGSYRFANMLYPIYIWLESQRFRKRKGS
ncbi:MAG: AAA family ATPase [Thermotogae bacterium]|nr:AAA family ATPase [Thermotogota bacterium]